MKKWTEKEVESLRSYASEGRDAYFIAEKLGRHHKCIHSKVASLGIEIKLRHRNWSKDDLERLQVLATEVDSISELARKMDRPISSVNQRLKKLGIVVDRKSKPWTTEEIEFIREAASKMTPQKAAKHLHRSYEAVKHKSIEHGIVWIKRNGGGPCQGREVDLWTSKDKGKLWELSDRFTVEQISKQMKRSPKAVQQKCRALGIKIRKGRYNNINLADELGISVRAVHVVKKRLGFTFATKDNPRAPYDTEIGCMAWEILNNPHSRVKVSVKHLKNVIKIYSPQYLTEVPPHAKDKAPVVKEDRIDLCFIYSLRNDRGEWFKPVFSRKKDNGWMPSIEHAHFYECLASARKARNHIAKKFSDMIIEIVRVPVTKVEIVED